MPLPKAVRWGCYALALPWAVLALVIYAVIIVGGFVRAMGRDYTPTLQYFLTAFGVERASTGGLHFTGSAWDSFWTTIQIAGISAPITAAIGILTAYLLARQHFAGKSLFEFGTMLSFAIPGTVIGVSYILAFNVPPVELTGTGVILVLCFVFRNMPVGVRAGLAALAQIDKSLDEASLTLGGRSATTLFRVVLPLLRPAIVATLVFSFVHAMTAVSAIIFLVSARYNMATAYIGNRVEAGEYALAIAYSTVLIVVMLLAILLIQLAVGERKLGRRAPAVSLGTT
jgi:iron(III) transport system permease protein